MMSGMRKLWRRWAGCSFGNHKPNRVGRCVRCGAVVEPLSVVVIRLQREHRAALAGSEAREGEDEHAPNP